MVAALANLRALLILGAFAWAALAHEYHTSLAEVELNPESGRLEVALRVIPEDLESALAEQGDQVIHLEAKGVDALIAEYLASRFRVVGAAGEPQSITWVGKEVSHQATWLYFEIQLDAPGAWTLENRIFFDLEQGQINTVLYRAGETRATWTFTVESDPVEIPR